MSLDLSKDEPQPALVLLCKRPALGHSKQRLATQIGLESALQVAEKLLLCALEDLQHYPYQPVIAPDYPDHLDWAGDCNPRALVIAQSAGNLGQRLQALDQHLRAREHSHLLYIGSDCPALNQQHFRRACQLLDKHDTVLIAARDGGVVLMASKRPWPKLDDLPWSTATLRQALVLRCRHAGHSVIEADILADVDHREDLPGLVRVLEQDGRPARRALLTTLQRLGLEQHASQ